MNKEIQLVINTPVGKRSQTDDSYIRKAAIKTQGALYDHACGGAGIDQGYYCAPDRPGKRQIPYRNTTRTSSRIRT